MRNLVSLVSKVMGNDVIVVLFDKISEQLDMVVVKPTGYCYNSYIERTEFTKLDGATSKQHKWALEAIDAHNAQIMKELDELDELNQEEWEDCEMKINEREEEREEGDNTVYADGDWQRQVLTNGVSMLEQELTIIR